MGFYVFLNRWVFPGSYIGKIMLVAFLGVHVPLIGLVLYLLLASTIPLAEVLPIVLVLLGATLLGTGMTLAGLFMLLAPVRQASRAIRDYLTTKRVPALPVQHADEAGRLLRDVQEGITRLDSAIDVADAAREKAQEEHRRGYALLSGMSHELRTPLNAIIGFSEMMQHEMLGPLGSKAYRSYASDIHASGSGLLELLQGLLDMSAAQSGRLEAVSDAVALTEAVEAAVSLKHLQAEQAGIQLLDELPAELPRTLGDPRTLKQQLLHLIGGMVQAAATQVRLGATVEGTQVVLSFAADGNGFDGDDLPELLRGCWSGDLPPHALGGQPSVSAFGFMLSVAYTLAKGGGSTLRLRDGAGGGRVVELLLPTAGAGTRTLAVAA